jgi:GrpB-like predicted nucleotidyltransferase (UPF0157 family)
VRRGGGWAEQFALLFRDYLHVHAEEARRYEPPKYQLAAKYREDRHGYTPATTRLRIEEQVSASPQYIA